MPALVCGSPVCGAHGGASCPGLKGRREPWVLGGGGTLCLPGPFPPGPGGQHLGVREAGLSSVRVHRGSEDPPLLKWLGLRFPPLGSHHRCVRGCTGQHLPGACQLQVSGLSSDPGPSPSGCSRGNALLHRVPRGPRPLSLEAPHPPEARTSPLHPVGKCRERGSRRLQGGPGGGGSTSAPDSSRQPVTQSTRPSGEQPGTRAPRRDEKGVPLSRAPPPRRWS